MNSNEFTVHLPSQRIISPSRVDGARRSGAKEEEEEEGRREGVETVKRRRRCFF